MGNMSYWVQQVLIHWIRHIVEETITILGIIYEQGSTQFTNKQNLKIFPTPGKAKIISLLKKTNWTLH